MTSLSGLLNQLDQHPADRVDEPLVAGPFDQPEDAPAQLVPARSWVPLDATRVGQVIEHPGHLALVTTDGGSQLADSVAGRGDHLFSVERLQQR